MAYTIETTSAFDKGENEEGYDYQAAEDLLKDIQKRSVGRIYVDDTGNIIYESRFARNA